MFLGVREAVVERIWSELYSNLELRLGVDWGVNSGAIDQVLLMRVIPCRKQDTTNPPVAMSACGYHIGAK